MVITTIYCDICKKEIDMNNLEQTASIKVISELEAKKGKERYFKDYFDVCSTCFKSIRYHITGLQEVSND